MPNERIVQYKDIPENRPTAPVSLSIQGLHLSSTLVDTRRGWDALPVGNVHTPLLENVSM